MALTICNSISRNCFGLKRDWKLENLANGNKISAVPQTGKESYLWRYSSSQFLSGFSGKLLYHMTSNRNFWIFWLNGKFGFQTTPRGWTLDNIRNSNRKSYWQNNRPEKKLVCNCSDMQVNQDFPQVTQRMPNKRRYVRRRHSSGVSLSLMTICNNIRRRPAGVPSNLKKIQIEIIFLFIEKSTNIITVKIIS